MSFDLQKAEEDRIAGLLENQQQAEAEQRREYAVAGAKFQSLNRLVGNPDFQEFLADYVRPLVETQQKAALDRKKTPDERSIALELHDFGLSILGLADAQREHWLNRSKSPGQ